MAIDYAYRIIHYERRHSRPVYATAAPKAFTSRRMILPNARTRRVLLLATLILLLELLSFFVLLDMGDRYTSAYRRGHRLRDRFITMPHQRALPWPSSLYMQSLPRATFDVTPPKIFISGQCSRDAPSVAKRSSFAPRPEYIERSSDYLCR